jgi:hypothetical protein
MSASGWPASGVPAAAPARGSALRRVKERPLVKRAMDLVLDQPLIFRAMRPLYLDPRRIRRPVTPTSHLVIDGYPRSANTFATFAFKAAQGEGWGALEVANHVHRPTQFLLAARWGVPALLVLRPPRPAVLSAIIFHGADLAGYWLDRYVRFHEAILPVRHALMVGRFAEVIADFGAVTARLNARFGTRFAPFAHSPASVAAVQAAIDADARRRAGHGLVRAEAYHHSRAVPTREREALKARFEALLDSAHLRPALARAEAAHDRLAAS